MADWSPDKAKAWLGGQRDLELSFDDLWRLILLRLGDHFTDHVDEDGNRISSSRKTPYYYDLNKIAEDIELKIDKKTLERIATLLDRKNWVAFRKNNPIKVALTQEGFEEAEKINDIIFNRDTTNASIYADGNNWSLGIDQPIEKWLLLHGHRASAFGKPYSIDGLVDFRRVADHFARHVTDEELSSAISDLEIKGLITRDRGLASGKFWAYVIRGGVVAAKLLEELWGERDAVPAASRFVRIDDNLPNFTEAISNLEKLIAEMAEIRINDWPEKEGMIASLSGALRSLKTKYVNKNTILAAVSSVTAFLALKFVDAPIAELAKATWLAVKNLF